MTKTLLSQIMSGKRLMTSLTDRQKKNLGLVDTSRGQAIEQMCLNCSRDSAETVSECAATSCPLWIHRLGTSLFKAKK